VLAAEASKYSQLWLLTAPLPVWMKTSQAPRVYAIQFDVP
jgi:hypothetical protein